MIKINMDMPKSCNECPLSYPKSLFSNKRVCLWEMGYRFYRLREGDKSLVYEIPGEVNCGEKLPNCPLQEVKE